jgi:hypothetical protein
LISHVLRSIGQPVIDYKQVQFGALDFSEPGILHHEVTATAPYTSAVEKGGNGTSERS